MLFSNGLRAIFASPRLALAGQVPVGIARSNARAAARRKRPRCGPLVEGLESKVLLST
jgi:hypothetical protein